MCDQCIAICNLIGELNSDEGNSVTILSANADFSGPNYAIETTAGWTNWEPVRYEGDTVKNALEQAAVIKRIKES